MSQDPTALQVTVLRLQADTHSDHAKLQEKIGGCYPPNCVYHRPWMETGETEKGRGSQDEGVRAKGHLWRIPKGWSLLETKNLENPATW